MPFNLSKRPNPKIGITTADFCYVAKKITVGVAEMRTVDEVESAGSGFLTSSQRPKILFEGHQFYRYLSKLGLEKQAAQLQPSICYSSWTSRHYLGREGEYARIAKATELCHRFGISDGYALLSASWGRYQIMGFNFQAAGFQSIEGFVEAMFLDEMRHLEAFAEYIESSFLDDELREHRWGAFALAYNGPGYKRNNYHVKLPNAFTRFSRIKVDCSQMEHIVSTMPGIRASSAPYEGYANTSLDDRYLGAAAQIVSPPTENLDPAGSQFGSPNMPALDSVEPAAGEAPASSAASDMVPTGDLPNVKPSSWFNVEDWKPFVFRWLARIWKAIIPANLTQGGALTFAAMNDLPNWYIYAAIAVVIFVLLVGAGLIISSVLLIVWLWNRREILYLKAKEYTAMADPNMKNIGLIFERK